MLFHAECVRGDILWLQDTTTAFPLTKRLCPQNENQFVGLL